MFQRAISRFLAVFFLAAGSICAQANELTLPEYLSDRLAKDPITIGTANKKSLTLEDICAFRTDPYARRVFAEYGSMFAAVSTVSIPWRCIFENSDDVANFQKTLKTRSLSVDGVAIDLQEPAINSLEKALEQAAAENLRIIPLDGAIAGRRSYFDTIALWGSRFYPALDYWTKAGKVTPEDAQAARSMLIRNQVFKIVEWESAGYYFGTSRTRSIFSSTAPPGTSQHLSLIALDLSNYSDDRVREIMAANGWYQTIINDPTHFTYLGVSESELPSRGLMLTQQGAFRFWVPRL